MTESTALVEKRWSPGEMALIKSVIAPKCSDEEVRLLLYQAKTYKLDPLLKQIWAVKYSDGKPASIFVGRDGYLEIAHQSGQFDGIDSGVSGAGDDLKAFATVWRKDMVHPTHVEVSFKEYNKKQGNWLTMPETMLKKVAESQALRKAFNVSGMYAPEEMPEVEAPKPPMKEIDPIIDADAKLMHKGEILIKDPVEGDVWVKDTRKKKGPL